MKEKSIDTLRVQEARLRHSISEAVKKFQRETGLTPIINLKKGKGKTKNIVI